ncbi:MAG: hypothetical protein Q7T81_05310 [Pseudolabrys sp.]|nr:hypothetical protein [Pseudolabrys sp.]
MSHRPRIDAFRKDIIKQLPRAPATRASLAALHAMPTHLLILAFVTWRMRFIPAKPRTIKIWSGGVAPPEFQIAKPRLRPLLEKVEAGKDLTPHLSTLVHKKGIILEGSRRTERRQDIDMVLTRHGLHHFHVGKNSPNNPKGRSDSLVFAEVLEKEFLIVAVADHRAFEYGSPEHLKFFSICSAYTAKDVPPGQAFIANPVMASGHSMVVKLFSDRCDDEISRLDPQLDDPDFIDKLYNEQPILRDGCQIIRPAQPSMAWYFNDLQFGILDRRTMVFFCIFPFFAR